MTVLSAGVPRQLVTFLQQKYRLREFIETGSFTGASSEFATTLFDYVLTIELDREFWRQAKNRFDGKDLAVECWQGDSAELMPGALRQLDDRALIWLDAHNVAGQYGDEDSCPLLRELYAIRQHAVPHIVLIADAHCFHPPLPMYLTPDAWPTIDEIREQAEWAGYSITVTHDLVILAPPHEMHEIVDFLATLPIARHALMRKVSCVAHVVNGPLKKGAVPMTLPAFTGLTFTQYGWMLVHRLDNGPTGQTLALTQAGISRDHQDIELLSKYLKAAGWGAVLVDIGANVGTYSFGLRRFCAEVHAFEPQRILFNMLAGSIALNGWLNVYCYNVALGQGEGEVEIPQYDYNKPLSFGSIEFDGVQKEPLTQSRGKSDRKEFVPLKLLDDYRFRRIDVLKIDVEGMELAVLAGAYETIQRCRPVLFIEHAKSVKAVLQSVIESLGYVVEEHGTMDFICLPLD